jgi:hypothetical protein
MRGLGFMLTILLSLLLPSAPVGAAPPAKKEPTAAKEVVLHFPTSHPVGNLKFFKNADDWACVRFRPAQGDVTIPAQAAVGLTINYAGSQDLAFLRRLDAPHVVSFDTAKFPISDEQMPDIARLTALHYLNLQDTEVTDKGLLLLGNLKMINHLNIARTMITGKGLMIVAQFKQLEDLDAGFNQLSDQSITALEHLPKLKIVTISSSNLGDQSMAVFGKMAQIKELRLDRNKRITDAGVAKLGGLHLKLLDLSICDGITAKSLKYFEQMNSLKYLYIDFKMTKSDLDALKKALPNCHIQGRVVDPRVSVDLFQPLHSPIAPP